MVDPVATDERAHFYRLLGIGLVVLIGGSASLTALYSGASLGETGIATGVGLLMGLGLVLILRR